MYQLSEASSPFRQRGRLPTQPSPEGRSVESALAAYLARRLGLFAAEFAADPVPVTTGWEAHVFRFRLTASADLPARYNRPLVLRLYCGCQGLPRAGREFAAQTHAYGHGYPVPEPLLLEEDSAVLGGPFVIMEETPGDTLLDHLRSEWTSIFEVPVRLAEAHLRLHALPTKGLSIRSGGFLARRLDELHRSLRLIASAGCRRRSTGWTRIARPRRARRACSTSIFTLSISSCATTASAWPSTGVKPTWETSTPMWRRQSC